MIVLDNREHVIEKVFKKNEIEFEVQQLLVGDIMYGNLIIERKDWQDYITSLRQGKLFRQIIEMENNFEKCLLVIIGNMNQRFYHPYFKTFKDEEYIGSLRALTEFNKLKVIHLDNNSQLCKLIKNIVKHKEEIVNPKLHIEKLYTNKQYNIFTQSLCLVDGIGINKAIAINEKYNFFQNINIDESKLLEVEGIGKELAKRIKEEFENGRTKQ